ncbi:matrixin family metalloprotease [Nocardioides halotolerans]|uniref:matrixin family metalloprotease n=1 Tax=Nocardioides halotolerans TaxID=433660 RepID=UPI000688B4AF|nr:matrixin family metalloprotease [Nocardioides halotolerans]
MEGSRRERREQQRWERRMRRQLRALDRAATAGPSLQRAARPRRRVGPVLPGLLISGILAGLVMLHDPGMTGYRFRQLVDHLKGNGDGSYAFVVTTPDGDPVGWDHCKPIHYVVNPAGAPEAWEEVIRGGVAAAADASGFDFQYDGTSIERTFDQRVPDSSKPPPVLIAWAGSDEVPDLKGTTAGIGGSTPGRVRGRVQFVTGLVVLDTNAYDRMESRGDQRSQQLILAHELGHVLGLDHVDDLGELMNAEYVGQDGFGPGDREGLERLHDLPCS